MTYTNLTPHPIDEQITGLHIPSSGTIRVSENTSTVAVHDGIPIFKTDFDPSTIRTTINGKTTYALPPVKENNLYIVSALVLNTIPSHRVDFVAPGNAVRDTQGVVIGCKGFRTI